MSELSPCDLEDDFIPMKLSFALGSNNFLPPNYDEKSIADSKGFLIEPLRSATLNLDRHNDNVSESVVSWRLDEGARTRLMKRPAASAARKLKRNGTVTSSSIHKPSCVGSTIEETPLSMLSNGLQTHGRFHQTPTITIMEASESKETNPDMFDQHTRKTVWTNGNRSLSLLPLPDNLYGSIQTASFFGDDYYYKSQSSTPLSRIHGLKSPKVYNSSNGLLARPPSLTPLRAPRISVDDHVGTPECQFVDYRNYDSPETYSSANTDKREFRGMVYFEPQHNPVQPDEVFLQNDITSVILRNYPREQSLEALLREMERTGFVGGEAFDFIFLPIKHAVNKGIGCAFINFVSSQWAQEFMNKWHKVYFPSNTDTMFSTKRYRKMCVVKSKLQGQEANIQFVKENHKLLTTMDTVFHPVIYTNGEKVPFSQYNTEYSV